MSEEIKIQGLSELQAALRTLPDKLQRKAVRSALAKAAKPIVAAARQLAPVKSGRMRRAIYSYRDRASPKTYESRLISVKRGKRYQKSDRDAYYWKFVEFGRAAIESKKTLGNEQSGFFGRRVKAVPPRPFMRPAFAQNKYKALQIVKDELAQAIATLARK
jgi:HK97 gp10 family phage protein